MVYYSRKHVAAIFISAFTVVVFAMVYMVSFYQPLSVSEASISVSGDHAVLSMKIDNNSGHVIRGADVLVLMGNDQELGMINGSDENGALLPGESVNFVMDLPFSKTLTYDVFVRIPFNKSTHLIFALEKSTIEPIKAEVHLSKTMIVGKTYDVIVNLQNVSESDLLEVVWVQSTEGGFFKESSVPRTVSIKSGEYKSLYSTLTPSIPGKTVISFVLRVGDLEQKISQEVNIVPVE